MTLKPALSNRSFAQKRKRKRSSNVRTTGASIYVCRYAHRQISLPSDIHIHFAQPRVAVTFRSQPAGTDVIDVQQRAGFSDLRPYTYEAACDAQDESLSHVTLSHLSISPHMTLEMQDPALLKTQRAVCAWRFQRESWQD